MDYREWVGKLKKIACVVSAAQAPDGTWSDICIAAANEPYLQSVHVKPDAFVPGRPYFEYIGRDHNFEAMTYKCMEESQLMHAYVDAEFYNSWMDIYMMPLASDEAGRYYTLFSYEMTPKASADKLADVSPQTALQVLRTTIKLRETSDFKCAMCSVINDIREDCGASICRIIPRSILRANGMRMKNRLFPNTVLT